MAWLARRSLGEVKRKNARLRQGGVGHPSHFPLDHPFFAKVWLAIRSFPRSGKRRMVEAAGVEPASENIQPKRLHAFPGF